MIRHIVLFSAKRAADVDKIIDTLQGYHVIPGLVEFSVSKNLKMDKFSEDFDIVLQAVVANKDALEAYKSHPIYLAGIDMVRPLRVNRIAVDVELQQSK